MRSVRATSKRRNMRGAFDKAEIEGWWSIIKAAGIKAQLKLIGKLRYRNLPTANLSKPRSPLCVKAEMLTKAMMSAYDPIATRVSGTFQIGSFVPNPD